MSSLQQSWDESYKSYMISVSSQWELGAMISTFWMWRPMGLLSVKMQRQCSSTPKLLRLIAARKQKVFQVINMHKKVKKKYMECCLRNVPSAMAIKPKKTAHKTTTLLLIILPFKVCSKEAKKLSKLSPIQGKKES